MVILFYKTQNLPYMVLILLILLCEMLMHDGFYFIFFWFRYFTLRNSILFKKNYLLDVNI